MKKISSLLFLALFVAGVSLVAPVGEAVVDNPNILDVTVTKTEDTADGSCDAADCSLREAIIATNQHENAKDAANDDIPDVIRFADCGSDICVYELTRPRAPDGKDDWNAEYGDLDIRNPVEIIGQGAQKTVIDGGGRYRIFDLRPPLAYTTILTGLTLQNGHATSGYDFGTGGAIKASYNTPLRISKCLFKDNKADGWGGAIENIYGLVIVSDSAFIGNSADEGGAMIVGATGKVSITNSTLSGNTAEWGGAIWTQGDMRLYNVTIYQNTAVDGGHGKGGGIAMAWGLTIEMKNSILAGNTDEEGDPDCHVGSNLGSRYNAHIESGGYNLIQKADSPQCVIAGDTANDITGKAPRLGALRDNGGPTPTHALLSDSPALNAGNPSGCTVKDGTPLSEDQRGAPRHFGPACDIGAFESSCGDGVLQSGEECDDGNIDNADACRNCRNPHCGDGVTDAGEQCDDGNTADGDGCSGACRTETSGGGTPPLAGGGATPSGGTVITPVITPDGGTTAAPAPTPAGGGCSLRRE